MAGKRLTISLVLSASLVVADAVDDSQRRCGLLVDTSLVAVLLCDRAIVNGHIPGCVLECIKVVERSELEGLGDIAKLVGSVNLSLDSVDFGSSAADIDAGSGMVFSRACASGKTLARKTVVSNASEWTY